MIDYLAMEFPHDTPQLAINTTGIGYLVNGTLNEENGVSLGGMDGAFLPKTGVVEIPFMYSDDINRTVQQYSSHHRVQRFLRNIITPIICVLGFLGNIINIIVLSRLRLLRNDGTRDSGTHLGLTVLAVSDMLFCMSMFPRCLVPESLSLFEKKDFYLYYQVYGTGVVTCFMLTSTWITVVMALMRYVGICHPFSSRKIDGPIFSKVAYATVFVFCIILNLPSFFMYKIENLDLGTQVVYLIDIGLVDQGSNQGQTFIWIKAILGILIPMTILSFCNCSLIRALRRSYRTRQQYRVHQTVSSTSNRITLTLIVVMMAFLILVFPSEIMDLLGDHINNSSSQTENFLTVRSFANVFQIINFAFNFVLYCVINVHFRGMLLQMLPCCRKWFPKTVAKFQRSAACARSPSYRTSDTALPVVNHRKRKTAETLLNGKV